MPEMRTNHLADHPVQLQPVGHIQRRQVWTILSGPSREVAPP